MAVDFIQQPPFILVLTYTFALWFLAKMFPAGVKRITRFDYHKGYTYTEHDNGAGIDHLIILLCNSMIYVQIEYGTLVVFVLLFGGVSGWTSIRSRALARLSVPPSFSWSLVCA